MFAQIVTAHMVTRLLQHFMLLQILPVVPKGTAAKIMNASLKRSSLWPVFEQLKLHRNMRVEQLRGTSYRCLETTISDMTKEELLLTYFMYRV
jgi:hypothetical protein